MFWCAKTTDTNEIKIDTSCQNWLLRRLSLSFSSNRYESQVQNSEVSKKNLLCELSISTRAT